MADSNRPKNASESPTRAFRLKLDGWLDEMLKNDLDPDAAPPADGEAATPPLPAPEPGKTPPKP